MKPLTLAEAAEFLRMSRSSLYQRRDIPRYRRPGSRVMLFAKRNGLAFDLDFRWRGRRYRPLLGYDLAPPEADRRAIAMIAKIQAQEHAATSARSTAPTFKEFLPVFWQTMRIKKRFDLARPASIIETHLLPRFADRRLDTFTAED